MMPRARLALLALLAACVAACGGPKEIEEHPCPPGGTALTYENFGKGFIDRNCQSCHMSRATERRGAPAEYSFDSREDVLRHRARIFARSAADNTSMPPGPDDPPAAERAQLADWLACGAN